MMNLLRLPERLVPRLMLLALLALLPFAALLGLDQWRDASLGRERSLAAMRTATVVAAANMDRSLQRAEALLSLLVERDALRNLDPHACAEQLAGLERLTPLLGNLGVVDDQGQVICLTRGDPRALVDLHQRPYVRRALASGAVELGKPVFSAVLKRPVMGLARKIDTRQGRAAVLILSIDLETQQRDFERLGLPSGARLWIEDADGTVIVGTAGPEAAGSVRLSQPLERDAWQARLEVPADQIFGGVERELRWGLGMLAVVLLLTLGLVWRLARRMAEPMTELAALSRQAAAGRLEVRAREDLRGEAGELSRAFNAMLSARARAEDAMRKSERHYRDMLEQSSLLAVALDGRGRVSYCNRGFADLVQEQPADILGRDWIRHYLPPEREAMRAELFESGRAGAIHGQSRRELCLPDGRRRVIAWSSAPRLGLDGEVIGLLLMGQDVTESDRAERQLERSRDMFSALWRSSRQLVQGSNDLLSLCSETCAATVENGHARLAAVWLPVAPGNPMLRPWGHAGPLIEVLGPVEPRLDPDAPEIAGAPAVRAMRTHEAVVSNDYLDAVRGMPWFERARSAGIRSVAALPLRRGGRVVGVFTVHGSEPGWFDPDLVELLQALADDLGSGIDQIDRRQAHVAAVAQANASLERFRLAAATGNVWSWEAASDRFSFQRNALARLARQRGDGSRAQDWYELVLEQDRERLREALVRHLKQRGVLDLEVQGRSVDCAPLWLHVRGQAVWDLHGRAVQMAGTVFDVTARREAAAAKAALQARSEFLGRMSHELRTPLNAMLGFAQLLQSDGETALGERQQAWLKSAEQAGWQLLALIDELMGMADVESWPASEP